MYIILYFILHDRQYSGILYFSDYFMMDFEAEYFKNLSIIEMTALLLISYTLKNRHLQTIHENIQKSKNFI